MIVKLIKCNTCGIHHDESKARFHEREYIALDHRNHYCKECAKKISLFDAIQTAASIGEPNGSQPEQ